MSQSTPHDSAYADRPLIEVKHRMSLMVAVIMISTMQFLDSTVANVALPHMRVSLGASSDSISWVLTSFMVTCAVFTPLVGWLSDRVGSRNLFIGSGVVFLLASAACGASTSLAEMVAFRAVQGASAAVIGPMTQTILFDINRPSKVASTMSLYGLLVMIAPICGPMLGGYLTESTNWRWVFYVNLPIGIPTLIVLWLLLPSRPQGDRKLDITGLIWVGLAVSALQIMLDRGAQKDWFDSWEIIIELLIAISAAWIYIVHHWHSRDPLINRSLVTNYRFLIGVIMMTSFGIASYAQSAVLPLLYQNLYQYPVVYAGILMMPRGIGVVCTSLLSPILIRHIDFRIIISVGYLVSAFSLYMMTGWSLETDTYHVVLAGFIQGLGAGVLFAPLNVVSFSAIPPELRPDGSALLTLARNVGSSFGISAVVAIVTRQQQVSHSDIAAMVTPGSIPAVDLPAVVTNVPGLADVAAAMADAEVTRQASMISFIDSFYALMWLQLIMAFLPLIISSSKSKDYGAPAMAME